ncbi:MAG: peptidoglycan endopeptidase [Chitinophagaceae bacterium]|nr:MAG: peptidoglycan endopeptidase [Chitinophagaceae bacterium]
MVKFLVLLILMSGCVEKHSKREQVDLRSDDTVTRAEAAIDSFEPLQIPAPVSSSATSYRLTADRAEVVEFAKSLIGIPYKYASSNPKEGFDCSGFITYVYNHFNEVVPRSSVDFTYLGKVVSRSDAKPGDLILFTGTDSTNRTVGHMGIVVDNFDSLKFIHSTSGKAWGVTITPLNKYYSGRFVKIIDLY